MSTLYDNILEREEYITPKEYLKRRANGQINPENVRYAKADPKTGETGGFWVKLATPRYRTDISNSFGADNEHRNNTCVISTPE